MSKKLKLSPWHDASVKPVHVGLYEVDYMEGTKIKSWQWWNGEFWGLYSTNKKEACRSFSKSYKSVWQAESWRGIVK